MNYETKWPDDAPEWATGLERRYYCIRTGQTQTLDYIERPKPAKQKIDWSKVPPHILSSWGLLDKPSYPSGWIAWNCDEHTRGNPLPDGLVVEWYAIGKGKYIGSLVYWPDVTRFRIVGIQEGWE